VQSFVSIAARHVGSIADTASDAGTPKKTSRATVLAR